MSFYMQGIHVYMGESFVFAFAMNIFELYLIGVVLSKASEWAFRFKTSNLCSFNSLASCRDSPFQSSFKRS